MHGLIAARSAFSLGRFQDDLAAGVREEVAVNGRRELERVSALIRCLPLLLPVSRVHMAEIEAWQVRKCNPPFGMFAV